MDQTRQTKNSLKITYEISSDRHTDTEITSTHQYNCLNRPNEPKTTKSENLPMRGNHW